MARAKKVDIEKVHKCYHCNEIIENLNDLVVKKIPMQCKNGKVRQYNRELHTECAIDFRDKSADVELRQAENQEWDDLYQYFKKSILGTDKPLDSHTVSRLLGLRIGQYYPQGNNTRILKRGYEFPVILLTLKACRQQIDSSLSSVNFKDGKHRIDYIMKIVAGQINDIQLRLDRQKKANEKLIADDNVDNNHFDYEEMYLKRKAKEKEKEEEESAIDKLFGGKL